MQQLHGSGKTAVLVERIIHKIIDEKIDIDKILVVTFTNAAASEMKQRVLEAIYKKIEEMPKDIHLQRQINLLNKASICTIHSFCLDVIRNNFYAIDASANFKVADTLQIELLKQEVLEDLFEEKYINRDEKFIKLLDTYTSYRGDEPLKEIILNTYKYIQSTPFPEKWLKEKVKMFDIKDEKTDFKNTVWGKILIEELVEELEQNKLKLTAVKQNLDKYIELQKYRSTISIDIEKLNELIDKTKKSSWDEIYILSNELKFDKWPTDKNITNDYKDIAKKIRDEVKKKITNAIDKIMISNSQEVNISISSMYENLDNLKDIVIEFSNKFSNIKKEKNIIDFNDIEHFALNILVKQEENNISRTEIAKKYMQKFSEIAIDEYQDSNLVQEYILKSISNGKNMFMVGDVKQSIYKFRQARPELFLEKYNNWEMFSDNKEKEENRVYDLEQLNDGKKIKLFKNFRSRENILDITNIIFKDIMSKNLGDIDYTQEEYLNLGANYPEYENLKVGEDLRKTELHIIDLKDDENQDIYKNEEEYVINDEDENENDKKEDTKIIENEQIEAKFVANKIKELIDTGYIVYDKKEGYRKITYKDIVILLRATSVLSPIYEKELSTLNFPVFSDTTQEYLDSVEIGTIMALLKIIDNPLDDIPLITVLRSPIGNFTDNDLVQIRLADKNEKNFYNTLIKARVNVEEKLRQKIDIFIERLKVWKKTEKYKPLDELIWQIYDDTNYYNYVGLLQNGALRQANLKMLFERAKQYETSSFKGLFNFIRFIDKLKISSNDMSAAKIIGENENVIRIMSIHKSKGLEFPVVFLCGTGKKFNLQDLNEELIMHQDLGFGPKYINCARALEYTTLAKEALKIKLKRETVSEEMRVLYVALTRAKEKLIITGLSKDIEKSLKDKEELLKAQGKTSKIDIGILKRYNSYLDLLELVYLNNKDNIENIMKVEKHNYKQINLEKSENEEKIDILNKINNVKLEEKNKEKIKEILEWKYKYIKSCSIPTKTSVTKIKELENKENFVFIEKLKPRISRIDEEYQEIKYEEELKIPNFMKDMQEQISYAQKGTLMHLCIQKLNEKKDYTFEDIEKLVKELEEKNIITKKEAQSIQINKIYEYTKSSDLWNELKYAKKIYKEEPFYINVDASTIYKDEELTEKILVQGIIDLYYIDKNDKLILVDYKTDYVENGNENILVEKYKIQLNLYKEALEKALNRKVDNVFIYSICLQKRIELNM